LVGAKNFTTKKPLRDEALILFDKIFESWKGGITELAKQNVKSKINFADACGRNKIFDW